MEEEVKVLSTEEFLQKLEERYSNYDEKDPLVYEKLQ